MQISHFSQFLSHSAARRRHKSRSRDGRHRKGEKCGVSVNRGFIDRPADRLAPDGWLAPTREMRPAFCVAVFTDAYFASSPPAFSVPPPPPPHSSSRPSLRRRSTRDERLVHLLVMVRILPDRSTDRPTGRRTSHLEFDQKYLSCPLIFPPSPSIVFNPPRDPLSRLGATP